MIIRKNSIVLFQGDSVTDCYRNRCDESSMGYSYVKNLNEYLCPLGIRVLNKGVAGNKVNNLLERFDCDFKQIKPDYIFILIGVNDTWHNFPHQKKTIIFKREYDLLLSRIKKEINVPVMILEPFIIGFNEEITCMKADLDEKIKIIKKLANKYNYEYISFKEEFDKFITKDNYLEYTIEGIHLLDKGYKIMSNKIIQNIQIQ